MKPEQLLANKLANRLIEVTPSQVYAWAMAIVHARAVPLEESLVDDVIMLHVKNDHAFDVLLHELAPKARIAN